MAITNYDGSPSTATPNYSSMVANFGKKQPKLDVYGRPLKQVDLSFLGNKASAMPQAEKVATLNSGTTPKSYSKPVVATAFDNGANQYNQNSPYVSALGFNGMQPNDVSAMQRSLGVNADGRFGANTANALVNAGMQPAMIGASSDQEYMDAMKTPATSQTYNPSDYSGNDWSSIGSNQNGSMMSGLSDYLGNVNSDGFWSHNVGNMPEGLSDVEKAAWLQSPSTFSNILGGVGTGASALSSLYGMYMQNKNYNLHKDAYNKQVAMARASEGRMSDFAKAMGGSYRTANI